MELVIKEIKQAVECFGYFTLHKATRTERYYIISFTFLPLMCNYATPEYVGCTSDFTSTSNWDKSGKRIEQSFLLKY